MSNDTRKDGLREAGIIADAVFDEQAEGSRGQQVAARIRRLIIERMNQLASPTSPPREAPTSEGEGISGSIPPCHPQAGEAPESDALSRRAQEATPENTLGEAVMLLRKYGNMEDAQLASLIPQALHFLCERCTGWGWVHGDLEVEGGMPIDCPTCGGTGKRSPGETP